MGVLDVGRDKKPNAELTIEQKITALRVARGVTQKALAEAMNCGISSVQRAESGERKYTEKELELGLKFLDMVGMPLTDKELTSFKGKIYVFRDRIRDELLEEARKLQQELSVIVHAEFEHDLIMLYRAIEARLMIKERKLDVARTILEPLLDWVEKVTNEALYHLYHSLGSLCIHEGNQDKALDYLLLADAMEADGFEKEPTQSYNLAACYNHFGKYAVAVGMFERIYDWFNNDKSSIPMLILNNNLGLGYLRTGHVKEAKEYFNKTLDRAKSLNSTRFIGYSLHNLGCVHLKLGEHKKAIDFFEEASKQFSEGDNNYLENLYFKALCQIEMKSPMREMTINRGLSLANGNSHYELLFNSLSHLLTISEKSEMASMDYIEHTTIPYILEKYEYYRVFDYFAALEKAYARKGNKSDIMKSLEIKAKAYDVHIKMTNGREYL